jgi:hypothetical protein
MVVRPSPRVRRPPRAARGVVVLERAIVASDVSWIYRVLWLTAAVASLQRSVYLWGTVGAVTLFRPNSPGARPPE